MNRFAELVRSALRDLGFRKDVRGKDPKAIGRCGRCGHPVTKYDGYRRWSAVRGWYPLHYQCPTFRERTEVK